MSFIWPDLIRPTVLGSPFKTGMLYYGKQDGNETSLVFILGQALTVKLTGNTEGLTCALLIWKPDWSVE